MHSPGKTDPRTRIASAGRGARLRGYIKRVIALRWLRKWQLSDRAILADLWGISRTRSCATVTSMIDAGLIGECEASGCPTKVLHLTRFGHEQLMIEDGDYFSRIGTHRMWVPLHPSQLNLRQVQHDLLAQHACLRIADRSALHSLKTGAELRYLRHGFGDANASGVALKIPDAMLMSAQPDGSSRWMAVEVQQSYESVDDVSRIFYQYAEAMRNRQCEGVIYASTSRSLLVRYEKTLREEPNRIWIFSDATRKWIEHAVNWDSLEPLKTGGFKKLDLSALKGRYYQYRL